MTQRRVKITVHTREAGVRLDSWLAARFTYHTLNEWTTLIETHRLMVNEASCQPTYLLNAGDEVAYFPVSLEEPEVSRDIQVLYEDDILMAINKPPNLPCHPAGRYFNNTLLTILRKTCPEARLVNRLDRETSGIILIAKNKRTTGKLGKQFERRHVTKEYQVLVEGEFPDHFTADGILAVDHNSPVIKKRIFCQNNEGEGETCSTQFRRLACQSGLSLVHVLLGTGRMHQIRATLCSLGYPVVGDKIYGLDETIFVRMVDNAMTEQDQLTLRLPHQALHAWRLTIRHPVKQKDMTFEAPLPRDIQQLLSKTGM